MGVGWIQTSIHALNVSYSARITDWPSSSKAEAMAIATSLYVCPTQCDVTIYTDSQCCIDTFKQCFAPLTTSRRFEKFNKKAIWYTICHIITSNALQVKLVKVKAHCNDTNN